MVCAEPVRSPLHKAVHDAHTGAARRGQQSFDVGQRLLARLLGKRPEAGVGPDDRALELLRDESGMSRCRDLGEVDAHIDAGTSPGGVAGTS